MVAPAGQKRLPTEDGQRRRNSMPLNGGNEGPVGGDEGGVTGHELPDPSDQTRNHSDKGRAVAVVAAAVRLPKRRHAEEAGPNPEGLGIRRWAPGQAVTGLEHHHQHGEAMTCHRLPKGAQPAPNLAGDGACKKDIREGIVVGHPTRGVRAEPVGRGDRMLTYRLKAPVKTQPCRTRHAQALSTKERPLCATIVSESGKRERGRRPKKPVSDALFRASSKQAEQERFLERARVRQSNQLLMWLYGSNLPAL
jgi:hypothetical protein